MIRSFRYLLKLNVLPNMAIVAGFSAVLFGGYAITGGQSELFSTYYEPFPIMLVIILFMLAFNLSTANLQTALSFGACRRDYFWALQGAMLVYTLAAAAIQTVVSLLSGWLALPPAGMLGGTRILLVYPLVSFAATAAGSAAGLLLVRSKIWRAVAVTVAMMLGIMAVVAFLLVVNFGTELWGDLPMILAGVMIAALVVSEVVLYRAIGRAVVK